MSNPELGAKLVSYLNQLAELGGADSTARGAIALRRSTSLMSIACETEYGAHRKWIDLTDLDE